MDGRRRFAPNLSAPTAGQHESRHRTRRGGDRRHKHGACCACVASLAVVLCIYGIFYMMLEKSGEEDCPVCHDETNTLALQAEAHRGVERQQWDPMRFHTNMSQWRECVAKTYPGYPDLSDYLHVRPVFVLTWHTLEEFLYIHSESVRDCAVPCFIASEIHMKQECFDEVDGFIFHPPTTASRPHEPLVKRLYQQWILFSTESELNYPILNDRRYMSKFDINMTYHLDADVPFTYFIDIDFYTKYWQRPLFPKSAKAPVTMMISNCEPKTPRNQYLAELMRYIAVDSYGQCFHNKDIPKEMDGWPWWEVKWNLTSQYKFNIAIENSISYDYVTEKLFHSFVVGSVPIYLGAPNVDAFLPAKKSIIKVSDFGGPKELASFIQILDKDDEQYKEYLQWKETGPSENFIELQKTSPRSGPCRLCKRIAELQNLPPSRKEEPMRHYHHKG